MSSNPYIKRKLPPFEKLKFWLFLVVMIVLFLLYGTVLSLLIKVFPGHTPRAAYFVRPSSQAWYFVGLVLSIGTTGVVMNYLNKAYLRAKYKPNPNLSNYFSDRTFEGHNVVRVIARLLTLAAVFIGVLIYDNNVVVDQQNITINEFTNFQKKHYPLKEIAALHYVREIDKEGSQIDNNYRISFKDGYVFDSKENMLNCKDLIEYLSRNNNLEVDTVESK